jgi:uncharacterized protein DUF4388
MVEAGGMTELSGTLEGLGLPTIARFLIAVKKTGCLQIGDHDWHAEIFFRDGSITSAALGSRTGLAALEAIVEVFPEAQFNFDSQLRIEASHPGEIELGQDQVLAHIQDVAARLLRGERRLPSLAFVPAATSPHPSGADRAVPLDRGMLETLLAVDGRRTVRDIVTQRQTFDALWELSHLADLCLIELGPEFQPAKTVAASRCPRIGFEDDPSSAFGRPTRLHRCFAGDTPLPLSLDQQRELCLTEQFGTCPRLNTQRKADVAEPAIALLPTPLAAASDPATHAVMPGKRRRPIVSTAIFGLGVVFVGALTYVLAPGLLTRPGSEETPATQIVVAGATSAPSANANATTLPGVAANPNTRTSAQSSSTPLFDEHFTSNDANWPSDPKGPAVVTRGAYRMATRQAGKFAAISAPLANLPSDVVISATFRKLAGPPGGGYGIIVRDQSQAALDGDTQNGRFYVLEVGDKGEVGIWRRDGDRWADLQSWQHSDFVKTGTETNDVTVRAVGDTLSLAVNGMVVATRSDSALAKGTAGLFIGGDGNQVGVSHFAIQSL